MFADAVENGLAHISASTPFEPPTVLGGGCEGESCTQTGSLETGKLLLAALERLDGVHLLPCHIRYSGLASVAESFKVRQMRSTGAEEESGGGLEALLHGRWLRGKEERLASENPSATSSGRKAPSIQGFVVAAQETTCNQEDMRKTFVSSDVAGAVPDSDCVEAEEPLTTVTALRPLAAFDKLCYWQQDREPTDTDDVPQSLLFLRAMAALHDYQDELKE
ncbi:hypothetical protein, conserved [Eimeria praecox]|uniref:Uncharacterized protein n=1 Tax=Eimeria praecox TaxID=51316 RepID=U6G2R3_9EIME|nr:hypothetical protein, conserved [Eimeria praecox]